MLVNFFTVRRNGKRRLRTFLTTGQLYALILAIAAFFVYQIFKASGYDMSLECSKIKDTCVISKTGLINPETVQISQFPVDSIFEVTVEKRKLENGKVIFDLLINNGPYADEFFIDYGFDNPIKANTVKMKMDKFLTSTAAEFSINKRCYFNDYFCF